MFGPFERAVAGRYLRARKGERFVSIIAIFSLVGIALGVATLIVVTSVMSGFQIELERRILGVNGHIEVEAYAGQAIDGYAPLLAKIRAVPGVVSALGVLDGQALLTTSNGGARGGLVRGITLGRSARAGAGQPQHHRRQPGPVHRRRRDRRRRRAGGAVPAAHR